MTSAIRAIGLALLLAIGLATAASAQEPQVIGTFRDWKAYVYQSGSQKVCYMASAPKKAEGNYSARGKIWMLVTRRSPGPAPGRGGRRSRPWRRRGRWPG